MFITYLYLPKYKTILVYVGTPLFIHEEGSNETVLFNTSTVCRYRTHNKQVRYFNKQGANNDAQFSYTSYDNCYALC